MDDPANAKARRGAHWTFDAHAFLSALRRLRLNQAPSIFLPAFDHGVGDPLPDAIHVPRHTQILIIEGNYLLLGTLTAASHTFQCRLDLDPWNQIPGLLDVCWFAECDHAVAMQRLYRRHVATGSSPAIARRRISSNDGLNAQLVQSFACRADVVFNSDF